MAMIKLLHREDCCGCGACAAACPHGAIVMKADGMGFRYPVVDPSLCVDCGLCEKVCAFHLKEKGNSPEAFAIRFPDFLDDSQSGGLAYAIMRKAVLQGYTVYGAAMDHDLVVRHRRVDSLEGIEPLRLSKYVQSSMEGIPAQVLADLKADRKVLFTGTPCQCAGISSLCSQYRHNLILADIVCHGVPAPEVWKGFLSQAESEAGSAVTEAVFRDPSLGWHQHKERLTFAGSGTYVGDRYTFLFYRNLMNRPSCGKCPFASVQRASDITMADCWGVERVLPGFADDDRGCSLLIVSTPAGESFCREFQDQSQREAVDINDLLQRNMIRPTKPNRYAKSFENDYLRRGFAYVERHYGRSSLNYKTEQLIWWVKKHFRR